MKRKTKKVSYAAPSEDRKALVQRGGARGYHGGSPKHKNRRDRKAARQTLKGGLWA